MTQDLPIELTPKQKLLLVEQMKADKGFMGGIRRGIADCKAGRIIPWSKVKEELGIR